MYIETFLEKVGEIREHTILRSHAEEVVKINSSRYYPLAITWKKTEGDESPYVYVISAQGHYGDSFLGVLRAEITDSKSLSWEFCGDAFHHPWAKDWIVNHIHKFAVQLFLASRKETRISDQHRM